MSEWISVKEQMPEVGVRVLTLDKWGHIHDRQLYRFRNGFLSFAPGLLPERDVTHWMPLPKPPEEERPARQAGSFCQFCGNRLKEIGSVRFCNNVNCENRYEDV